MERPSPDRARDAGHAGCGRDARPRQERRRATEHRDAGPLGGNAGRDRAMTHAIHLAYTLLALSSVGGGAAAHHFFQFESARWAATIAGACLTPVLLGLVACLAVPLGALALAG